MKVLGSRSGTKPLGSATLLLNHLRHRSTILRNQTIYMQESDAFWYDRISLPSRWDLGLIIEPSFLALYSRGDPEPGPRIRCLHTPGSRIRIQDEIFRLQDLDPDPGWVVFEGSSRKHQGYEHKGWFYVFPSPSMKDPGSRMHIV
jgi:hypothetical protein